MGPRLPPAASRRSASSAAKLAAKLAALLLLIAAVTWGVLRLAPWAGSQALETVRFSRVFLDRTGAELALRPVNEEGLRRLFVERESFPADLEHIVLASEDRRFFLHPGVDPLALLRAGYQYLQHGEAVSGASTVTMQLSGLLHRRPRTPAGKIAEIVDALQLETRLRKPAILELYVNLVPMGSNVEGFPAAARLYFGRDLVDLHAAQLALLAVVPRSPSRYDPWRNPDAAGRAATRVLARLPGFDEQAAQGAIDEALLSLLDPARGGVWPFEAPHFVEFVSRQLQEEPGAPPQLPRRANLVRTTLDLGLQRRLERLLASSVGLTQEFRIGNAAGLLADPRTGEILAYAGSADFRDVEGSGQVDGVQMRRQPGSTLKPFLYAEAFELGLTPATIVPDIPLEFGSEQIYIPANFNDQYHGPLRIREALAASLNVPAVYTLQRVSVARFTHRLIDLGFTSLVEQQGRLGVSLALGGADVSLYELVQGYLSLYSDGSSAPLSWLHGRPGRPVEHWDPATASLVRDIISSNVDRAMTFGLHSALRYDFPVAIKTGTSNQFNNIWAIAFSADLAGGVWMGNFGGQTVIGAPGASFPARVLRELIRDFSTAAPLPAIQGVEEVRVCATSGMLATDRCTNVVTEYVPFGAAPPACDWHAGGLSNPVVRYPQEYRLWADRYGYRLDYQAQAPLRIISPVEDAVFYYDASAPPASQQVRIFVTGTGAAELSLENRRLFIGDLPASVFWPLERGMHLFRLHDGEQEVVRRIEVR